VSDAARRVFHLVALDEYRENFPLTTIASACQATSLNDGVRAPMGCELGIPGAHSDVGGGYRSGTDKAEAPEVRDLQATRKSSGRAGTETVRGPRDFVYVKGWYAPQDKQPSPWHPERHQRQVHGDYYKVGLSIMVDMAERYTSTVYPPDLKADMQAQTPDVAQVQTQ
ncbi:MAG: phospholipase effector Tle1 domain-containing protein, partial [Rhodoferax sp.]